MSTSPHAGIIASKPEGTKGLSHLSWWWIALACAVAGVVWKLLFLRQGAFPLNADEAVVGLMARHILAGERPLFFYGQAYMGSLDAALVALVFNLTAPRVEGIRIVQILFYVATSLALSGLVWKLTRSRLSVLAAGLLLAFPTVNTTLYTTVSLGGYGEALLIGAVQYHLALDYAQRGGRWRFWTASFLTGFGLWVFGLSLVFSVPSLAAILLAYGRREGWRKWWQGLAPAAAAGLLGALPWLIAVARDGLSLLVQELLGGAIADASGPSFLQALSSRLVNVALFGPTVILGIRPPWSVEALAPLWIPWLLLFWFLAALQLIRNRSVKRMQLGPALLAATALLTLAGLLLTPFGNDPSGRYFLPFLSGSVVVAAFVLGKGEPGRRRKLMWALFALTLGAHAAGTMQAACNEALGITTQFDAVTWIDHRFDDDLIDFLEGEGLTTGYTNYWVAYPLAFQSDETLRYVPRLPYHQDFRYAARDDRYSPYHEVLASTDRFAYITTNHPELDLLLERRFHQFGVDYDFIEIGDYSIYYNLAPPLRPEELDLPWLDEGA